MAFRIVISEVVPADADQLPNQYRFSGKIICRPDGLNKAGVAHPWKSMPVGFNGNTESGLRLLMSNFLAQSIGREAKLRGEKPKPAKIVGGREPGEIDPPHVEPFQAPSEVPAYDVPELLAEAAEHGWPPPSTDAPAPAAEPSPASPLPAPEDDFV